jgi:hypothetical protein
MHGPNWVPGSLPPMPTKVISMREAVGGLGADGVAR